MASLHSTIGAACTARRYTSASVIGPKTASNASVLHPLRALGQPCAPTQRRRPRQSGGLCCRAQEKEEHGASAVGHDLTWNHVARDVRSRLAATASGKSGIADQLQAWLREADLRQRGESDQEEHSQAEVVAAEEASRQGLDAESMDVAAWLGSEGDAERDAKMAGALVMRLLQAYHKEAGEPFDDEQEDSYWRLQGFVPGSLVSALDHDTLKRLVKGYLSIPFSGV